MINSSRTHLSSFSPIQTNGQIEEEELKELFKEEREKQTGKTGRNSRPGSAASSQEKNRPQSTTPRAGSGSRPSSATTTLPSTTPSALRTLPTSKAAPSVKSAPSLTTTAMISPRRHQPGNVKGVVLPKNSPPRPTKLPAFGIGGSSPHRNYGGTSSSSSADERDEESCVIVDNPFSPTKMSDFFKSDIFVGEKGGSHGASGAEVDLMRQTLPASFRPGPGGL